MSRVMEIHRLPGCVRVRFDDGTDIPVPPPLFSLFRLRAGDETDPEAWQAQWSAQAYGYALDRAAALLGIRDASEKDVADRLRRSGYPEQIVARVMQTLTRAGYVDDARYADRFVQSRAQRYGNRRLYGELRRKGVNDQTAREALASLDPEDEAAAARRQAEKLLAWKDTSDPDVRRKAVQALVRRGFDWDTARGAVEAAAGVGDSDGLE